MRSRELLFAETPSSGRAAVAGELGTYGRRLVLMVLGAGLALVVLNMYGAVTTRRRDFGRRRALGASRGTIIGLVTLQTALTGIIGAALGTAIGAAVVWRLTDQPPDPAFAVAVAVLAVIATIAAALPCRGRRTPRPGESAAGAMIPLAVVPESFNPPT